MFEMKVTGLNEAIKRIDTLGKKVKELDGQHSVAFSELFSNEFCKKHTKYNSIEDLINSSGFKVESQEDFKNIPDDLWDEYIKNNTEFPNWKQMMDSASKEWAIKKLGL